MNVSDSIRRWEDAAKDADCEARNGVNAKHQAEARLRAQRCREQAQQLRGEAR